MYGRLSQRNVRLGGGMIQRSYRTTAAASPLVPPCKHRCLLFSVVTLDPFFTGPRFIANDVIIS